MSILLLIYIKLINQEICVINLPVRVRLHVQALKSKKHQEEDRHEDRGVGSRVIDPEYHITLSAAGGGSVGSIVLVAEAVTSAVVVLAETGNALGRIGRSLLEGAIFIDKKLQ
jgi:hypothetical protein